MTRILSELLGVNEQRFRASIDKLERASGHLKADIALTAEQGRATKVKLHELGLDPHNTTGEELYTALQSRFQSDDARLLQKMEAASTAGDAMVGIVQSLQTLPIEHNCFALKLPVMKTMLKKLPPKKAMKQLGYRSLDSMLKREPAAAILTAADYFESASWHRQLFDAYKKLKVSDFENRTIAILLPNTKYWIKIAPLITKAKRHTVFSHTELGALVLLPIDPLQAPPAAVSTTLILALHAINEIRAGSTFLKLCQVKPNFGELVQTVATAEPQLAADILDQSVPWQIIQRYYARFKDAFNDAVFEPHIQLEDLSWHSVEQLLEHIEPSMGFWMQSQHLSLLDNRKPVSCNLIDVALNYCNQLSYANRFADYAQVALWHELLLKYLKHENIERAVLSQLQPELVAESAAA